MRGNGEVERIGRVPSRSPSLVWKFLLILLLASFMALNMSGSAQQLPKLSGALQMLLHQYSFGFDAAQAYAETQGVEIRQTETGDRLTVVVESMQNVASLIQAHGGLLQAKYKDLWQVDMPLDRLQPLAEAAAVSYIRLPQVARLTDPVVLFASSDQSQQGAGSSVSSDPIISEGAALTGALDLQHKGITGKGVKVGVIDLGFAGVDQIIERGEVPEDVVTWNCLGRQTAEEQLGCRRVTPQELSQVSGREVHGTAVAEIIHDMAPDAQLHLFLINTEVGLGQAMMKALDEGVRVINHSVAWFNDGSFYDGRGVVGRVVRDAWQNGIFWVNAAGNFGQTHYQAVFQDKDRDNFHDEAITLELQKGEQIRANFTWNAWPRTDEDFDLILERVRGAKEVALSHVPQNKTEPDERLVTAVEETGTYRLRIKWVGEGAPPKRQMELFVSPPWLKLHPAIPESSLPAPANAPETFAVGAVGVAQWKEGLPESFSSQGPTNPGRSKPDLVAPDCVRTASYESFGEPFCGTSAAAPHVAGAAALLLSENPELDPEGLSQLLIQQAQPIPGASPNQVGAGELHLGVRRGPDLVIENVERVGTEPLEPGQPIELIVKLKNQGEEKSGPFWLAVWLKEEERQPGQELISRRVSPGLAPGEEREVRLKKRRLSEETASMAQEGELKLVVIVDAFDDVVETDEDNNRFELSLPLARAELTVQPQSLEFRGQEGGEEPPAQSLTLKNTGTGGLEWEAKADQEWVKLDETTGALEAGQETEIEVGVKLDGLSAGTYEGEITITAEGAQGSPTHIPVKLVVEPPPAALEVSPQELNFQAQEGGENPRSKPLTIRNTGGQPLNWSAAVSEEGRSWLSLSRSSGTVAPGESATVQINVNISSLSAGTYQAEIEITAEDARNSPQRIAVTLEVVPGPARLQVSPTSLSFSAQEGGSNPSPKSVIISNVGGQSLEWHVTTNVDWILPGVSGGTLNPGESFGLLVFIKIQGLSAGTHHGTITINAPGAEDSPVHIEVTLTLRSS